MTCGVEVSIRANAEIVWRLLTDAKKFPRRNSTVTRIDGQIREGERLRLHGPGTNRTFTPKVSGVRTGAARDLERWRCRYLQGRTYFCTLAAKQYFD
jgi:uncharacterized protein YndB with AHSA1/START domain